MHPEIINNRNKIVLNGLMNVNGNICDITLIFLTSNHNVIHDQIYKNELHYIFFSAELVI